MNNEPVAIRYDFDGYGYQYMDSGSGSDWQTRVKGELLYTNPACKHGVDDGACKECYQEATEPVAWGMTWKDGEIYDVISPAQHAKEEGDYTVPLYNHPVKELPTKDDEYWLMVKVLRVKVKEQQAEIDKAITESFNRGVRFGYAEGLRKAQEK